MNVSRLSVVTKRYKLYLKSSFFTTGGIWVGACVIKLLFRVASQAVCFVVETVYEGLGIRGALDLAN